MKRGDLVTVAVPGSYGKPRPAVVVQSDALSALDSVLVALATSFVLDAPLYRLPLGPTAQNGLRNPSDIMVEKLVAMPRAKVGPVIGSLTSAELLALDRMLAFIVGIADREPERVLS